MRHKLNPILIALFIIIQGSQVKAQENLQKIFIETLQSKVSELKFKILIKKKEKSNSTTFYHELTITKEVLLREFTDYRITNDTLIITCKNIKWDPCEGYAKKNKCNLGDIQYNGNLVKINDLISPLTIKIALQNIRAEIPRSYLSGDPVLYFQEAVRFWPKVENSIELCELVSITVGNPHSYWTDEKAPELEKNRNLISLLNMISLDGKNINLANFKKSAEQASANGKNNLITEEQRKFIVQANVANEEKKYLLALELYQKAFEINEFSYPQGYFNSALIAAQLQNYILAIINMEKYLILAPNADDARKAQDKIYEWEFKIKY